MNEKTFYDIHMHALNLSHPYLLAFIQRLKIHQILVLNSILGPIASLLIGQNLNKIKNLLAVMENDIGSFFLLVEDYLKRDDESPLLRDGKLHIGGNVYSKIVLTPLMMDFGYKDIKDNPNTYYNELSQKPIVEQVIDVFNGIKKYKNKSPDRIFEIYPFLGLNTKNYDMGRIERMLDKYFDSYEGSREDLNNNMGKFDGNIEHLGNNFFAGIKVYPPLGFDPWPDNKEELEKVKYLYSYCCEKGIPITAHGSKGGFVVVPEKEAKDYTSISKWESVLKVNEYSKLKISLAHFPIQERFLGIFPKKRRLREILNLISNYDNVYVDFSNRAVNDKYYVSLKRLIDRSSGELKAKLKNRILFGSDFTINLMSIESYNKYLDIFSKNTSFGDEVDLRFLHREICQPFAVNLLGLEDFITTEEKEGLVIAESKLGSGDVFVGIQNTSTQARAFTYSLDLERFGLPQGKYWVHSIDEDLTLGGFESEVTHLRFNMSLDEKVVKMLVISSSELKPPYSVETAPPIPSPEP